MVFQKAEHSLFGGEGTTFVDFFALSKAEACYWKEAFERF